MKTVNFETTKYTILLCPKFSGLEVVICLCIAIYIHHSFLSFELDYPDILHTGQQLISCMTLWGYPWLSPLRFVCWTSSFFFCWTFRCPYVFLYWLADIWRWNSLIKRLLQNVQSHRPCHLQCMLSLHSFRVFPIPLLFLFLYSQEFFFLNKCF